MARARGLGAGPAEEMQMRLSVHTGFLCGSGDSPPAGGEVGRLSHRAQEKAILRIAILRSNNPAGTRPPLRAASSHHPSVHTNPVPACLRLPVTCELRGRPSRG